MEGGEGGATERVTIYTCTYTYHVYTSASCTCINQGAHSEPRMVNPANSAEHLCEGILSCQTHRYCYAETARHTSKVTGGKSRALLPSTCGWLNTIRAPKAEQASYVFNSSLFAPSLDQNFTAAASACKWESRRVRGSKLRGRTKTEMSA